MRFYVGILHCVITVFLFPRRVEGQSHIASLEDFPWNAGLYRVSKNDGKWQLICGASLIHPRLLLTAAHCVTTEDQDQATAQNKDLRVRLGSLDRDYQSTESTAALAQVKNVMVPAHYLGRVSNFALDVALLELTDNVKVTDKVRPTRIDWQSKVELQNGQQLKTSGWDREANATSLTWSGLKYEDYKTCVQKLKRPVKSFVTPDKFCLNAYKGISKLSGSGITVTEDDMDYILGVLSVKFSDEDRMTMVGGTNVTNGEHRSWLQQQLKNINLLEEVMEWSASTEYKNKNTNDDVSL